ncbi:cytochrome b-c1 complex subunit 7 [Adelges cooleyi]|uniref:cytochrome b-c1 complex subunit 7 n=1 Tax=Adelges cooleyi TaxID=133065 RepID=UPI00217FD7BB|nr:cytochrome b-c1 complex subunit 7 [Adelges cooleyi]
MSVFKAIASNVGIRRWAYNLSGFNKYGLHHDDILQENEDVKEALRRIPTKKFDERTFRLIRAMQLELQKIQLPKEEWTKFEEDDRYLQPYLEEVIKEREEKEYWEKNYY